MMGQLIIQYLISIACTALPDHPEATATTGTTRLPEHSQTKMSKKDTQPSGMNLYHRYPRLTTFISPWQHCIQFHWTLTIKQCKKMQEVAYDPQYQQIQIKRVHGHIVVTTQSHCADNSAVADSVC